MFTKVIKNVYLVGGMEYSGSGDCCIYLLNINSPILIDSGLGRSNEEILDNIYEVQINPYDIKYLILTHCHIDHIGGARALRDKVGLKVVAHEKDADAIKNGDNTLTAAEWYNISAEPIDVGIVLRGDGGIVIEDEHKLRWYHIPGHTQGSIAMLYESDEGKVLFGQDIHGPLVSQFGSNRRDYENSLRMLLGLNADILCEGHYGVIKGRENVKDFISQFI